MKYKNLIFNGLLAILTLIAVSYFYRNIILTTALVGIIGIVGLARWKSKTTLILFVLGGILGTVSEMICVLAGAWSYSINNLLGVPLWLFLVWGNASAFLYQTGLEIQKLVKK